MARDTGVEPVTFGFGGARDDIGARSTSSQTLSNITDPAADAIQRSSPITDLSKDFATNFATTDKNGVVQLGSDLATDRFLTVAEVAERLRVSHATVYRLLANLKLEYRRVFNAVRIPESALSRFLAQSKHR